LIRFTGYGVIGEKPRVGQLGRNFPCTMYRKTMRWMEKTNDTFLMASTSSIHMQSLGNGRIAQRAPAVGAKHGVCMFVLPAG